MSKSYWYALIFTILVVGIAYFNYHKHETISPYKQFANLIPKTYRIGFTSLDEEISIDNLPITGKVPEWLSGMLLRNGPAKFNQGNSWVSNWFDGLAMIHAFKFDNGKVSYSNKFLRTDDFKQVQETGKMSYGGFAQDPCKSKFRYLLSYFTPTKKSKEYNLPNANVNIAKIDKHIIALTETPLPIEFDTHTLETLGGLHYNDGLPEKNIHDTAHPHYDPVSKEYVGYFTRFGRVSSHNLFSISAGTTKRNILASVEIDKPSYMHSFAITPHYAILTLLPLVVNPLDLLLKNQAFIKNFKWEPDRGTQLVVIDRINKKVIGSYKAEPFFAFHTVNAFEKDNNIILDIVTYPTLLVLARHN